MNDKLFMGEMSIASSVNRSSFCHTTALFSELYPVVSEVALRIGQRHRFTYKAKEWIELTEILYR